MSRTALERAKAGTAKRVLHWVGGALALASIVFVALRLREHAGEIDFERFGPGDWIGLAVLAVAYGSANILLALAWRNLLAFCGERTGRFWAVRAYGISQLGKYVPGNIFHFAGRQAIGLSAGLAGWPLARSALWELGLISVTGGLFVLLAGPLVISALPATLAVLLFLAVLGFFFLAVIRVLGRDVAAAMSQQALFLLVSGTVFVGALILATPDYPDLALWPAVVGAYVIAWLAGLLTPGAPAGIGVREVVLLFLLGNVAAAPDLVFAVVLARLISVVGDGMFFLSASLLRTGEQVE